MCPYLEYEVIKIVLFSCTVWSVIDQIFYSPFAKLKMQDLTVYRYVGIIGNEAMYCGCEKMFTKSFTGQLSIIFQSISKHQLVNPRCACAQRGLL